LIQEDTMKEIGKLAVVVIVSAGIGALVAEAVHAKVTSTHEVTGPAAVTSTAQPKSWVDWEAARNQSFGSRVLATGGSIETYSRRHIGVSAFGGMDKMQASGDGLPLR
jgi:hypothetical protein